MRAGIRLLGEIPVSLRSSVERKHEFGSQQSALENLFNKSTRGFRILRKTAYVKKRHFGISLKPSISEPNAQVIVITFCLVYRTDEQGMVVRMNSYIANRGSRCAGSKPEGNGLHRMVSRRPYCRRSAHRCGSGLRWGCAPARSAAAERNQSELC